jgi:ABC-type phosphate transport system substrate-binding protein
VSPVVATLILILIAVAAAAALYLWLVAWQGGVTSGIGSPSAQYTVTIGGSTSVYPFSSLAATWFEQNNSDVVISDNQGGTGAGMLAVCDGNVNVGAASTPETPAGLAASDNCPSTGVTVTTIAYDAVDVIVPTANVHGLQSIYYDTLTYIYDRASTTTPTLQATSLDGVAITSIVGYPTTGTLAWDNIPAVVNGATVAGVLQQPTTAGYAARGGAGQAAGTGALANDIVTAVADGSPCGFTICAGPFSAVGDAAIAPVERSDASGTTQTFEAKILGATSASAFATSFSGLGYSGCGSNNLLADCGIAVPTGGNGNPGVISAVGSNPNAIGYASDGLVRAAGSGVNFVPFLAVDQVLTSSTTGVVAGAVEPTTGATGTIAAGITNSATVNQYSGWRPFEFVTLQPPTGEVQRFFGFITDPANNINLATATGEVSIYSV